jgi:DNA polymerase III delta subunit
MDDDSYLFYDEACRITSGIERSIVRLRLESQGQFVALINALDMQLDSGEPEPTVIRLLSEALLALADAKRLDRKKLKLDQRLGSLNKKIATYRTV